MQHGVSRCLERKGTSRTVFEIERNELAKLRNKLESSRQHRDREASVARLIGRNTLCSDLSHIAPLAPKENPVGKSCNSENERNPRPIYLKLLQPEKARH